MESLTQPQLTPDDELGCCEHRHPPHEGAAGQTDLDVLRQQLATREAELQVVFDYSAARIWLKDDKNVILRANRAAAESMGIEEEALQGADTYDLFPDMAAKYHKDDLAVIESGEPRLGIVESYAPADGVQGWVSTDKIPIQMDHGKRRLLVMSQDITEHKKRVSKLESLNRSLREFASVAAHDLKSPLRQVSMLTDILNDAFEKSSVELPPEAAEAITDISKSMDKMLKIVDSLSDLTMLEARPLSLKKTDISKVLTDVRRQIRVILQSANAEIHVGHLPVCVVDEELMSQVFQNLILNACKYSGDRPPRIRVWSTKNLERRAYEVMIEDQGVGIAPDQREAVFRPFKRAYRPKDIEGSGLGLTITRRIMVALGGSIVVDDNYNDGLRLILRLPF